MTHSWFNRPMKYKIFPELILPTCLYPKKTKNIFYMISKPLKLQIISSPIPESAFGQCRVNIIPTGLMHAGKP